jgi:hypothetical protein
MLSGQRLQPCGADAGSWNGEILSLPSASTLAGLVTISEKQSSTPWCARTVSMKKVLASLTTFKSHLQTGAAACHCQHQRISVGRSAIGMVWCRAYPSAAAVLTAETTCVSSGALLRQSRMSSGVFPLAWSSAIILSWKEKPKSTWRVSSLWKDEER